eukprot:9035410-Pyramimonas_sp.AAC.1
MSDIDGDSDDDGIQIAGIRDGNTSPLADQYPDLMPTGDSRQFASEIVQLLDALPSGCADENA